MTTFNRIVAGHYQSGLQAPVSGLYVPVPAIDDVGGPLSIDIRPFNLPTTYIRITCEITDAQAASSDPREGVFYVFSRSPTAPIIGLPGDYQFDIIDNCPDTIGVGFSVREVVPYGTPFLLLLSRTTLSAEVRLRSA